MKKLNWLTAVLASTAMLFASLSAVSCSNGSEGGDSAPSETIKISSVSTTKVFAAGGNVPAPADFTVKTKTGSKNSTLNASEFTVTTPSANKDDDGKLKLSESATGHSEEVDVTIALVSDATITKNYAITVVEVPTSISVTYPEDFETSYFVGEKINKTNITVTAYYGADDTTGTDITNIASIKGNPTETATASGAIIFTFAGVDSDTKAITVTAYDGGIVTEATADGLNKTEDGYTGSLYRGWTFTTSKPYDSVAEQWPTKTTITTNASFDNNSYYKVSFVLTSSIENQSTAVNITDGNNAITSAKFTTNATDNNIVVFVNTDEDPVSKVSIDIGHGWTGPDNTFTIKNLKIEKENIADATAITLTADNTTLNVTSADTAKATLTTKADMGYFIKPEYSIVSETGSSNSVIEDGVLTVGAFNNAATTTVVTVKAVFGTLEDTIDITVNLLQAYDETKYTFGDVIESSDGWTYNTQKTAGVYTTKGLQVKFSTDGKAMVFTHKHPEGGWDNNYETQVIVGACPGTEGITAGDVYTVSFKAFFSAVGGNITDPDNYTGEAYTNIKTFSKDVTAVANQYKDNAAEAVLGFMLGWAANDNPLTIYDINVTKKASN